MNIKRMRGRNHRPNNGGGGGGGFRNQQNGIPLNRNHVFDSSGPEMRVRGTAQQLHEKYMQLARDASSSGDRVTGEAYYQHAEHYFRIISAINQAQGQPGQPHNPNGQPQNGNGYQNGGQNGGQNDYQRRNETYGGDMNNDVLAEPRPQEPRYQEPRYQEPRQQEPRQQEPRQQEPRQQEPRQQEPRYQEARPQEPRQQEPRQHEPRRQEQRPYEPRNKPEFQRPERYRPEAPLVDAPIDISSALEAELAAAAAEPAGFGEQPVIAAPPPAPESRAIPIISDTPPPAAAPRPRGRPRLAKNEPAKKAAEE